MIAEPSPLLTATMLNADACANAVRHVGACSMCPPFPHFFDAGRMLCAEGMRLRKIVVATEEGIRKAVVEPARREVAS